MQSYLVCPLTWLFVWKTRLVVHIWEQGEHLVRLATTRGHTAKPVIHSRQIANIRVAVISATTAGAGVGSVSSPY